MEFNEYLKELRSKKFADTNKLSKLLKVSRNMWQKIESGINPPPRKSLLVDFCRLILCKEYEKNQLSNEIDKLNESIIKLTDKIYSKLTAWECVQVARHPQRPHFLDYVE